MMNFKEEPKYTIQKELMDYTISNSNVEEYFASYQNETQRVIQNINSHINKKLSLYNQDKPVNQIKLRRCASENLSDEAYLKTSSNQSKNNMQRLNNTKINQKITNQRTKNQLLKKENKNGQEFLYEVCLVGAFIFFIVSLTYTINKELKI